MWTVRQEPKPPTPPQCPCCCPPPCTRQGRRWSPSLRPGCGWNVKIFRQKYSLSLKEILFLLIHLVDFILNLLVHHPIHNHLHLVDCLVNLLVHHPIHDHHQTKDCHYETFKHIKCPCCCPPPPSRPRCCCCPPPGTRPGRRSCPSPRPWGGRSIS